MYGILAKLLFVASATAVAILAMRPKLSLALLATIPVALTIGAAWIPDALPDWLLISGIIATAVCLAAVIVAFLFRRSGDVGGEFGTLPSGREMRYSSADKAGLWWTFVLLCVAMAGSAVAAWRPPFDSVAVRVVAIVLAAVFAALARSFRLLLRDRDVVIRIDEQALEVDGRRVPWQEVESHTFSFGIFRVYAKSGERVLRVDNTIDGFPALLYHVNRKTFRNVPA